MGVQQDLFFFHALSPGCAFFLPLGGRIYNTLIDYMREKYWEYEYEEVRERGNRRGKSTACCTQQGTALWRPCVTGAQQCLPLCAVSRGLQAQASCRKAAVLCALRHAPTTAATVLAVPQVVSPNIFNFDLWKTSGHADHYRDNMFSFDVEKQEFGLKPMNCPGHCIMFGNKARSYR